MARHGRISGRTLAGAAALAVVATGALAGTASAHTQNFNRTCTAFTVDLTNYPGAEGPDANWVTVTVDGKPLVVDGKAVDHVLFPTGVYHLAAVPATVQQKVVVTVWTKDDPKGTHQPPWSGDFNVPAPTDCPTPTPTPTPAPTSASPTVAATSASPTVKAASGVATPKPSSTSPALASTGGGSSAGLIAGIGGAVLVLGGGLVFLGRRRAGRH